MSDYRRPVDELPVKDATELALTDYLIGHDDGQPAAYRAQLSDIAGVLFEPLYEATSDALLDDAALIAALSSDLLGPEGRAITPFYETGSITPEVFGTSSNPTASYTGRAGHWVRVGKMVFFLMNVGITSISGGSGAAVVGPLPHAVRSATPIPMRLSGVTLPSTAVGVIGTTTSAGTVPASGYGVVPQVQRSNASMANVQISDLAVNSILTASGVYEMVP